VTNNSNKETLKLHIVKVSSNSTTIRLTKIVPSLEVVEMIFIVNTNFDTNRLYISSTM